jgi:hypothetical protein
METLKEQSLVLRPSIKGLEKRFKENTRTTRDRAIGALNVELRDL